MLVARFVGLQQVALARHDDDVGRVGYGLRSRIDGRRHQLDHVLAQLLQLVGEGETNR